MICPYSHIVVSSGIRCKAKSSILTSLLTKSFGFYFIKLAAVLLFVIMSMHHSKDFSHNLPKVQN